MSTVDELKSIITSLYTLVKECYSYIPYVYEQDSYYTNTSDDDSVIYTIKYKNDSIPENSLIYMLPKQSSKGNNKLKIVFTIDSTGSASSTKEYDIYTETLEGTYKLAGENSIIVNRLAIFRIKNNMMILLNNPEYNSLSVSTLTVTGDTIFKKMPVYSPSSAGDTSEYGTYELSKNDDLTNAISRIETLENQFVVGTEDISDVKDELEDGQFYIQIANEEVE